MDYMITIGTKKPDAQTATDHSKANLESILNEGPASEEKNHVKLVK